MPVNTLSPPLPIQAIAKWHLDRWYAFSAITGNPMAPIHKRCLVIEPGCRVNFSKDAFGGWIQYKVLELIDIGNYNHVILENDSEKRTESVVFCSRVIEDQKITGRLMQDDDDTKTQEEIDNGEWHTQVKYFVITPDADKANKQLLTNLMLGCIQEAMLQGKNILDVIDEKGYKLVKK